MAVAPARTTERQVVGEVLARDLVYVTGKGGAGKTTIAAALALAAAAMGRRALVCEMGGAHALAGAFPAAELSIDAHEALLDWMRAQPGGAIAAATLRHSRAFTRFVEAAPGARSSSRSARPRELLARLLTGSPGLQPMTRGRDGDSIRP